MPRSDPEIGPAADPSSPARGPVERDAGSTSRWVLLTRRPFLVEAFIALNLAFLAGDVYVAHSVNVCCGPQESIPVVFSVLGAAALLLNLTLTAPLRPRKSRFDTGAGRWVGLLVGGAAILVGTTGLILHLESNFFQARTLRSLVYSAPFVAPLAFTGLGLLLLANRLVPGRTVDWGRTVLLLAWGGFVGNFVLSLVDHAQNGFFYPIEWIPVGVAALTVGWLLLPMLRRTSRTYLKATLVILALAAATGIVGFGLHLRPAMIDETGTLADRIIYGAPVFAPLLFPNLALLAAIGVWDLMAKDSMAGES
jgi:hypothetical protein